MSEPYQVLESELGRWCGRPDTTVVCNSGTAALHLALEALRLPPGSEVLVPELTFIACARAVVLAGLTTVFVDCDERLLMSMNLLEDYCAECDDDMLPKAVMLVHAYGRRTEMDRATNILARQAPGRFVIEDLAEAHGVAPHPRTDAACWSFYRNKVIAGEEGGAVAFKSPDHADLARKLRSQGYSGGGDWVHLPRGMNYRMTNAQAELIRQSLRRFGTRGQYINEEWRVWEGSMGGKLQTGHRREIEGWYDAACPDEWRMPPRDVPWVYDLRVRGMDYETQTRVVKAVQALGVAARCGFKPMSSQEEFKDCRRVGDAKVATVMSREVIALPIEPGRTTRETVRAAMETLRRLLGG